MGSRVAPTFVSVVAVVAVAVAAGARAQEWACSPWAWAHPEPFPLQLSAVVQRDGLFWGFGATGVAVSSDGLHWQRKSQLSGKLSSVLWTGTAFLGTAENTVAASADGVAWATRHEVWQDPVFFTIDLRAIASSGSRFVVVGENYSGRYSMWSPVLLTSADGVAWSRPAYPAAADPSHSSLSAVVWAKGRFIAVGSYLLTSADGESWSKDETVRGRSLASDGDRVVVADDIALFVSSDLSGWEATASPVTEGRIGWLSDRFWLAGRCAACPDHEPSLWSSVDGRTWQRAALDVPIEIRDFATDGTRLVVVGGGAATSATGDRWQTSHGKAASGLAALASGNGTLVAVGDRGELLADESGGAWHRVLWGGAARLSDVAWGSAGFVAVGEGVSLVSRDGLAWSSHPTPDGVAPSRVVADGSRYRAVTWNGRMFVSADGVAWAPVDLSGLGFEFNFFHDLVAGSGAAVASVWRREAGGALITSRDGVTWERVADTASGLPDLAWGGGRFLATDFDKVLASSDGVGWQTVHAGLELVGLLWAGDRFVAWDRGGKLFSSADGSLWDETAGPVEGGTAAVGSTLWRVAGDGTIRRSVCGTRAAGVFLPSLAHLPGWQGTIWRSDVELHNPGDDAIIVGLAATPRGEVAVNREVSVGLAAGESRRLDDVLGSWLGVEEAATVEATSWGGPALVAARTYNETPAGTYGQFIPAHPRAAAIEGGGEGRLIQLAHSADPLSGFRTNIGLVSVGTADVPVDLELRRGDGALLGTRSAVLRAGESVQINNILGGLTSTSLETAFAVVRPAAPGSRVLAYASVIDNATGDPIFVRPSRLVEAGEPAWLPGSGHLGGLGGSAWRTDLEIHNPGTLSVSCAIDLFSRGAAGGPAASVSVTIPAGAAVRLPDVVWQQFGHQGGATLRLTPSGGSVMASARTYTGGEGGTFGQYVAAMVNAEAVTASSPGRLIKLRQSALAGAGFRTNIGLVNITPRTAEVEIDLHAGSGAALGRVMQTLRADEAVQLNEVLRLVADRDVDDAYAIVRTTTPEAAVLAYACLIDNRTNDPVFMLAMQE